MPADESLAYYWASIGFSAAGVVLFLWLMRAPARRDPEPGIGNRELEADPEPPPSLAPDSRENLKTENSD